MRVWAEVIFAGEHGWEKVPEYMGLGDTDRLQEAVISLPSQAGEADALLTKIKPKFHLKKL